MKVSDEDVLRSIKGIGGEMIRKVCGIEDGDSSLDPSIVVEQLHSTYTSSQLESVRANLGARAEGVIYSALFNTPLAGTEKDVSTYFGDTEGKKAAFNLFISMKNHLYMSEPASSSTQPENKQVAASPIGDRVIVHGTEIQDPISDLISRMGLPSQTPRSWIGLLIFSEYIPGLKKQTKVTDFLHHKMRLNDVQKGVFREFIEATPTLSSSTWKKLFEDIGGQDQLPAELHSWFPYQADRPMIAVAMTQANDLELVASVFPAPGTRVVRQLRQKRADLKENFPDLGNWFVDVAFANNVFPMH